MSEIPTNPDWHASPFVSHQIGALSAHLGFELPHPNALQRRDAKRVADALIAIDAALNGKADTASLTALANQIAAKADATALANLADTLTALTVTVGQKATPADITAAIDALKTDAPDTLDTLGELAALAEANSALIDTLTAAVAGKAAAGHAHDDRYYQRAETYSAAEVDAAVAAAFPLAPEAAVATNHATTTNRFVSAIALEQSGGTLRLNITTKIAQPPAASGGGGGGGGGGASYTPRDPGSSR